jgi:hypothetical protein
VVGTAGGVAGTLVGSGVSVPDAGSAAGGSAIDPVGTGVGEVGAATGSPPTAVAGNAGFAAVIPPSVETVAGGVVPTGTVTGAAGALAATAVADAVVTGVGATAGASVVATAASPATRVVVDSPGVVSPAGTASPVEAFAVPSAGAAGVACGPFFLSPSAGAVRAVDWSCSSPAKGGAVPGGPDSGGGAPGGADGGKAELS